MADQAVIAINGVWKIFGDRAEEAMEAIKEPSVLVIPAGPFYFIPKKYP